MKDLENLPLDRSKLFGGGLSKLLVIIAHPLEWQVCLYTPYAVRAHGCPILRLVDCQVLHSAT